MNIKDIINQYIPYDREEECFHKAFAKFLQVFGEDVWTRDNVIGHICASAWVVNKEKAKVLMA